MNILTVDECLEYVETRIFRANRLRERAKIRGKHDQVEGWDGFIQRMTSIQHHLQVAKVDRRKGNGKKA